MDIEVNILDIKEHTYYDNYGRKFSCLSYTLNYKYQNETIYLKYENGETRNMLKLWKRKYMLKDIEEIVEHSINRINSISGKEILIKEFTSKPITIHIKDKLK